MKTALSGCPIASWALVCLNTRCNPFQTQRWADGMNIDLAITLWRALAAICRPAFHLLPSFSSVPFTPSLSFSSCFCSLCLSLCRKLSMPSPTKAEFSTVSSYWNYELIGLKFLWGLRWLSLQYCLVLFTGKTRLNVIQTHFKAIMLWYTMV